MSRDQAQEQARQDAYESPHPISRLPVELLSEIFLLCNPAYPKAPPLFGIDSPLKLTQICTLWRAIAHSTPRLWTAISLIDPDLSRYPLEMQLATARRWLARARGLPLSVVFDHPWTLSTDERDAALAVLLEYRAQWEYAVLKVDDVAMLEYVARAIVEASLLKYLEVHANPNPEIRIQWPFLPAGSSAPKLETLFLHHVDVPLESFKTWDWSHLTRVHLPNTSVAVIASLLPHTPNLVACHVVLMKDDLTPAYRDAPAELAPIALPRLETLVLRAHDDITVVPHACASGLVKLLRALTAPALQRLYLDQDLLHWHPDATSALDASNSSVTTSVPPGPPGDNIALSIADLPRFIYDPRKELLPKLIGAMGCTETLRCLYVAYTSVPVEVYQASEAFKGVAHVSAARGAGVHLLAAPGERGVRAGHEECGWPRFTLG
ncbi:F-box domain-containing protein [Mycena kentingensis (nom. inval.)]|nr:F-box domain-containing protein [Mycena kentingensis (nom. inval.)]